MQMIFKKSFAWGGLSRAISRTIGVECLIPCPLKNGLMPGTWSLLAEMHGRDLELTPRGQCAHRQ
jgi:hypothetical protein